MLLPIKDYNPTNRTAYITIFLICINAALFLYQSVLSPLPLEFHIIDKAMVPYEVSHYKNVPVPLGMDKRGWIAVYPDRSIDPILSIFVAMFMHGSLWHLLGNMLFLWIFGNNIEDYLGKLRFLFFYLACGVGASLVHVLFNLNSYTPVIGASGAVSGVMGAYLVLYPHAKVRSLVFLFILVTFVDIPAFIFLIVWFLFQFFYAGGQSGIAWLAHVGGFVLGILLIKLMQRRPRVRIYTGPHGPFKNTRNTGKKDDSYDTYDIDDIEIIQ